MGARVRTGMPVGAVLSLALAWGGIAMLAPPADAHARPAPAVSATGRPTVRAPHAPGQVGRRAMWVWTRPAPRTLVGFATRNGVSELFLAVPPDLPHAAGALRWVRAVATLARPAGITLQALGGDPGWLDAPRAALGWQRTALSTRLFSGVHLDVEPWQDPRWENRTGVEAAYVDLLRRLAADTALPVEADVAFWLWTVPTDDGTPLDRAVMDVVDRVTIMSYRDTVTGPDSITGVGAHELATAASTGTPVRLAVETNPLGDDPVAQKQTFAGSSRAQLGVALDTVNRLGASAPGYAGIAVEDYAGWSALR